MIEHEADVGSGRIGSTEILPKAATNLRLRMMDTEKWSGSWKTKRQFSALHNRGPSSSQRASNAVSNHRLVSVPHQYPPAVGTSATAQSR